MSKTGYFGASFGLLVSKTGISQIFWKKRSFSAHILILNEKLFFSSLTLNEKLFLLIELWGLLYAKGSHFSFDLEDIISPARFYRSLMIISIVFITSEKPMFLCVFPKLANWLI